MLLGRLHCRTLCPFDQCFFLSSNETQSRRSLNPAIILVPAHFNITPRRIRKVLDMNSKQLEQALSNQFPPKPLDVAKTAVFREVTSKSFKLKAWALTPLPAGFWTKNSHTSPAVQEQLIKEGNTAMRRLVFDGLPLLVPASDEEWEVRNQRTALHIYSV